MKVLILTTSFPSQKKPFVGVFIKKYIDHLPAYIRPVVLTPASAETEESALNGNYQVFQFKYAPAPFRKLAQQPGGLPNALKTNPFTIFILPFFLLAMLVKTVFLAREVSLIHANWSLSGAIACAAGKLLHKPVVTTFRGSDLNNAGKSRVLRWLIRFCIKRSAAITVVSRAMKQGLELEYKDWREKIYFVPNGVDSNLLHKNIEEQVDRDDKISLVTVGNLVPIKNIDLQIKLIKALTGRFNVHLTIIGDGPEKRNLVGLTQSLGLVSKISFLGNIGHEQVINKVCQSDIFLFSSKSEGRPNAILEAMALGKPIIASDIDGNKELIEAEVTGELFSLRDFDDLHNKITRLIVDKSYRQKLGEKARDYVAENKLIWSGTSEKYANIYKDYC